MNYFWKMSNSYKRLLSSSAGQGPGEGFVKFCTISSPMPLNLRKRERYRLPPGYEILLAEGELFIDEHTNIPEFRRMKLEKLHEAGKYDEVIHLARLGVEQDSGLSGLVRDWREWILKGAKGKEDLELQKEVLAQLYDHSYELSYYRELKSLYSPSDWQSVQQKILQNLDGYWRRKADVLIEEGMQNELWQLVSNHISLDVLTKYDRYLLPAYIEEIRNHYKNFIPKFLDLAKGRKHYQRIANLLSHRIDLLGEEFCDNLIRNLLQIYPNRPAMRDEFRQAGFVE